MKNRNSQDISSEEEEWNAVRPTPGNTNDMRLIQIMRDRLAQIDLTDPRRVQCMPSPLQADVSWTVEKTSVPKLAEMCNGPRGCYRAKSVCTCDRQDDAS